ncbi:3-keto-disaccharide hydrolase [Aureliella helgolandensis]|uniref:3-keto-alpha-glucoside-1,2-lyase/3-keto-2-hydroxy-glucal hydratase domain-containing protein n=1 Tax=Aureliella helgolandensis TaxID=2527968 RepID=A0A518G041_9BACT|nr:DUF1080 domain-containing protein [Aureliella helgolandensis]QDV21969.1 hypothetical protein Q31a_02480 [Aureliella helgolandensis]
MRHLSRSLMAVAILTASTILHADDGFKEIFNGKDLTGWKGNSELWSVEDGAITGTTSDEKKLKFNTFLIWEGEVADFVLELDYKLGAEGNSGIQYRSKVLNEEDFIVGGYQADIDASLTYAGINYEEKGRGILTLRGVRTTLAKDGTKTEESIGDAKELGKKIHGEDWNHYRVEAKGNKLSHYINDQLMSEVIDNQTEKSSAKGVLALQIHQGPPMKIQFKNMRLKVLK